MNGKTPDNPSPPPVNSQEFHETLQRLLRLSMATQAASAMILDMAVKNANARLALLQSRQALEKELDTLEKVKSLADVEPETRTPS